LYYIIIQFRSPEEYAYEPQTEKVDVFSLGNIYYGILTGLWPFYKEPLKQAQQKIMNGVTPPIVGYDDILLLNNNNTNTTTTTTTDPFDQVLIQAMFQCWTHDRTKRASARHVQRFIAGELKRLAVEPTMDDGGSLGTNKQTPAAGFYKNNYLN
jgi:serine/threonine protein kinase